MDALPTHEPTPFATDVQASITSTTELAEVNGSHAIPIDNLLTSESPSVTQNNSDAFTANNAISIAETSLKAPHDVSTTNTDLAPAESSASLPMPGLESVPTEKTNNSHPTPPPEQPEQPLAISNLIEAPEEPLQSEAEESMIKPEIEQSVPALSTYDSTTIPTAGEALLNGIGEDTPVTPATSTDVNPMTTFPEHTSLVRPREEDTDDDGPASKRSKVEDEIKSDIPTVTGALPQQDIVMSDAAQQSVEPATPVSAVAEATYFTAPITDLQKTFLIEKTKNLKKTKHAIAFLQPVDAVKLNIPSYPNIVKNPMDLTTLETKLKNDQYSSPQDYANDFTLIVTNSKLFNGDSHPVTGAALNMEATFKKYMSTLPGPQQTAAPKHVKRASPAAPRPQPRREARQPVVVPPPSAPATMAASPSTNQTFALQPDGTPQIRRDSTTKRPHRTIKPPQSRELPYAKPKRKEHQLELKFCEHILDQVRGPGFGHVNHVFLMPVDPVALNIPHYRQVIKSPMDLSTMAQKLKSGQYGTAKEFKADFELMVNNCLLFNPIGNPVRDLGLEMKRLFEGIWKEKDKWERNNKKSSERASSASESEEEDDEDEDDEDPAANARETIAALTKQLAELQKTVAAASWAKDGKKKKDSKKSKKSSFAAPSKSKSTSIKSKSKKVKALSYDEKQEISNAVGQMSEQQVSKLTQIITDNCEKYRNMGDDMELEIDELPNDIQHLLLKYVRSIFGNPSRGARAASPEDMAADDDDDFAPPARDRVAAAGKRKKHKPMGKVEQQQNIADLRNRLAAFNNPTSGSESPTGAGWQGRQGDETSGDEESEESEEE